jgi:hypothetical protein
MDLPVMTQLTSDSDIFVVDDFFNHQLIADVWQECQQLESVDFIDRHGVFKDRLISKQTHIDINNTGPFLNILLEQIRSKFDRAVRWDEIVYAQLFFPWDIHCDLQGPNPTNPFVNLLIPFNTVNSSTVIFNERSPGFNDFWKYKKDYPKQEIPVPEDVWNEHLSMCWPEDREWLSIKEILPTQTVGQLIGFKRDLWHSSDSFHLKGVSAKHFLQILVDTV